MCGAFLSAAAAAAYSRTFSVPLLYDDLPSIRDNPTLRHVGAAFWPPFNSTVSGRPVLNISLAINYAASGTSVWSYHALNLALLVLAGLTLFGIIRRTLSPRADPRASGIAFCIALLWVLHPLLSESVTYVIQRGESLMGLFYLLTLYCFIRGAWTDGKSRGLWYGSSVASCLLGMGTKEVMVSAPLVVLLYDRTFLAGGFAAALRRRWRVYAGLAATWSVLPLLVVSTHGRGGTAGFGYGVSWGSYALTQLPAITHYLSLSLWPHPLVFDYGSALSPLSIRLVPYAFFIGCLVALTAWALTKKPALGFLGISFFAILAPSSSIVPVVTETMAEHRMFLPLVPVVVLVVASIYRWLGRAALPCCLVLGAGLFGATWQRNEIYRSEIGIWSDTAAKVPGNERAHNNLGTALAKVPARQGDAIAQYEEALRLKPDFADAHYNMGNTLSKVPGRQDDAIAHLREALRIRPNYPEAHNNLGTALANVPGRMGEAIAHFEEALRLKPDYAEAHNNLGTALANVPGRMGEATAQFEEALRLEPDYADAHYNLGNALANDPGRLRDSIAQYEEALRLKPDFANAHYNLGNALGKVPGGQGEAIAHYEAALRLQPDFANAHFGVAFVLLNLNDRLDDAKAHLEAGLRLRPDDAQARQALARIRAQRP